MKRVSSVSSVRGVKRQATNDQRKVQRAPAEHVRQTCASAVEYAKSLSSSSARVIESVVLVPSQFSGCAGINVVLVKEYASRMVSPLIAIEGESKVFKNKPTTADAYGKSGTDMYFLRVRVSSASPMLYQLMDAVYTCMSNECGIPHNMRSANIGEMEETTFKDGCLYINKISNAMVEYTSDSAPSRITSMAGELESLSARESQMAKLVIAPVVVYHNNASVKLTFALKRISMSRIVRTTIVDSSGEEVTLVMTETSDDDDTFRGSADDAFKGVDDDCTSQSESLFNI